MTIDDFAALVRDMRAAQIAYLGSRWNSDLANVKRLEELVDAAVVTILAQQGELFDANKQGPYHEKR